MKLKHLLGISMIALFTISNTSFADCQARFEEHCGPNSAASASGETRCGGEGFKYIAPAMNLIQSAAGVAVPGGAAADMAKKLTDEKIGNAQQNRRQKKSDIIGGNDSTITKTFRKLIKRSGSQEMAVQEIKAILAEANQKDTFCPLAANGKPRFATIRQIKKYVKSRFKGSNRAGNMTGESADAREDEDEGSMPDFIAL